MTVPDTKFYRTLPIHPVVKTLAGDAQVLLATLYWYRNARTGQLNPRQETIAKNLGWSLRKIQRRMRDLRETCIIRTIPGQRAADYEILPVERWHRKPCKPRVIQLKMAFSVATEVAGQDSPFLNERETFLSELKTEPPPPSSDTVSGSGRRPAGVGGAPAAPKEKPPRKAENPPPAGSPGEPPPTTRVERPSTPVVVRDEHHRTAQALVGELAPIHPTAGNMARAVEPIARLLRSGEATLESLRSSHAAYRRMWANYRRGRFIPQLWRWIEDNDWRYAPDEAQIKSAFNPAEREAEAEAQKTAARLAREIAEDAEREKRAQEKRERALAEWRQLKAEGRIL